jgi:phenylacetate-CoA ligase
MGQDELMNTPPDRFLRFAHKPVYRRAGTARPNIFVMLRSEMFRRCLYPVLLKRWRPTAQAHLRILRNYEFAPNESIHAFQLRRLRALVFHAAHHVPYYTKIFREHGIHSEDIRNFQDFARIPILSKATVQQAGDDLLAADRQRKSGLPNASGGSTGKPVQFFQDSLYWDQAQASQTFVESWWGIRPGERTASLWGTDRDIPDQSWRERLYGEIGNIESAMPSRSIVPGWSDSQIC